MDTKKLQINIPDTVKFSDLQQRRDSDGHVSFDWAPIEKICDANGINIAVFRDGPEDNVAGLLAHWYGAHLAAGGAPDPVQEQLRLEVFFENTFGGGQSYPPGTA